MRYVIIAGGTLVETFVKKFFKESSRETYTIACDKGYLACEKLGITPDLVIGDFDSAGEEVLGRLEKAGVPVERLNPIKDDTDTEAALKYAIEKSDVEDTIYILGGTGGNRIDHMLGNIALLGMGLLQDRYVVMEDSHNFLQMIKPGDICLVDKEPGKFVSVIPYMGKCTGVTMKGFKYPLENATIEGFDTLTISNEVVDAVGEITVEDGYLIVVESRD